MIGCDELVRLLGNGINLFCFVFFFLIFYKENAQHSEKYS